MSDLENLNTAIKKLGWFKTIIFIFLINIPSFLGIVASHFNQTNQISKISATLNQKQAQETDLNVEQQSDLSQDQKVNIFTEEEENRNKNKQVEGFTTFDPSEWIIQKFSGPDKEGYYCREAEDFPYWSMWTRNSYDLTFEDKILQLSFKIKVPEGYKYPPTIVLTYGEYNEKFKSISEQYYRLSIFDTDSKTIRLYDNKNNVANGSTTRLGKIPTLDEGFHLSLEVNSLGSDNNKVNIVPILNFNSKDSQKPVPHKPEKDFIVSLPEPNLKNITKQIGVGINEGLCLKIESLSFINK